MQLCNCYESAYIMMVVIAGLSFCDQHEKHMKALASYEVASQKGGGFKKGRGHSSPQPQQLEDPRS